MNTRTLTLTALVLVLVVAIAGGLYLAAGDDDPAPGSTDTQLADPSASGTQLAVPAGKLGAQGLSIAEARVAETPENLLVRGFLVTQPDGLVLCERLDAGVCQGDRLAVDGEPGVEPDGPEPVLVLGTVEADRLEAVDLASS